MFTSFSGVFSRRGSIGLYTAFKKRKRAWMQNYLSASDESAMGPLSQILKSESYAVNKERHIDCHMTPSINGYQNFETTAEQQ